MSAKKKTAGRGAVLTRAEARGAADPVFGSLHLRKPQWRALDALVRTMWLVWRRQFGKSYYAGTQALEWMAMAAWVDVLIVSASLRLGSENIRKEAKAWLDMTGLLRLEAAARGKVLRTSAEDEAGNLLDVDAVADLFEHGKLESKLYHGRTEYSRTLTVAPNPDTAVGHSAYLILDEVGRMPEFADMWESLEPVISSNPQMMVRGMTTPPPDDSHASYEMLCPALWQEPTPDMLEAMEQIGRKDALIAGSIVKVMEPDVFPVNGAGNFYLTKHGHVVHRVDAWDAEASGVPMYDLKTGEAISAAESRRRAPDKTAWDRNYGCKFVRGGSAAISLMALANAQAAGRRMGVGINVTEGLVA